MSTRYVWEKRNWKCYVEESQVSKNWHLGASGHGDDRLLYSTGYSFDPTQEYHSRFSLNEPCTTIVLANGKSVNVPKNKYFKIANSDDDLTCGGVEYSGNGCSFDCTIVDGDNVDLKVTSGYDTVRSLGSTFEVGDFVGYQAATKSSAYENKAVNGDYYFVYLGYDSIDPTAVKIPAEILPGDTITAALTARANTYGGTITYTYSYSVNGGSSWESSGSTTATTKSITVPADAKQFRVRVVANDNYGFTSTTYVKSANVEVKSANSLTVCIGGVKRETTELHAGVGGVKRQLEQVVIGHDGVVRTLG